MKIILYMTQTMNGMIARKNYKEDFLSDENWDVFSALAKKSGCFVIGRKTYEEVKKEFNLDKIKAIKIIVSTKTNIKLKERHVLVNSPKDAIKKAKELGFRSLLLTGGGILNSSFLKNNLIDEIIIDIEPYILGKGISIFSEEKFEKRLKLINIKKLRRDIIQLHYKIKK